MKPACVQPSDDCPKCWNGGVDLDFVCARLLEASIQKPIEISGMEADQSTVHSEFTPVACILPVGIAFVFADINRDEVIIRIPRTGKLS